MRGEGVKEKEDGQHIENERPAKDGLAWKSSSKGTLVCMLVYLRCPSQRTGAHEHIQWTAYVKIGTTSVRCPSLRNDQRLVEEGI